MEWIQYIDEQIIYFINGFNSLWLDRLMIFFSGKLEWIPLYLLIILGFYDRFRKDFWKPVLVLLVCIAVSDRASSGLAKPFFERLRPCFEDNIVSQVHLVISCSGKYGFFSSHASNSFVIATFSYLLLKEKRGTILLFLWATLVALSRVYLIKHYFTDVLVGAIFGSLIGYLVYWLGRRTNILS
ncbi:MAG: phosphatase PAP2 family protein [Cyclobacteriaceae bacterium]